MIAYIKLLFVTSSKKITPWILMVLGSILTFVAVNLFISSKQEQNYDTKEILAIGDSLDPMLFILPFIFISAQLIFLIVHLFKEGEKDGSELLILSKPILRRNILLSKLIVISTFVFVIHIIYFISMYFAVNTDTVLSSGEKFRAAISFGAGGMIVSFIIVGLSIFFSTFFGPMQTLFLTMGIAALFPFASTIIYEVTKGDQLELKQATLQGLNDNDSTIQNVDDIYYVTKQYEYDSSAEEAFSSYKKSMKYKKIVPFDIWYQWTKFFTIFNKKDSSKRERYFSESKQMPQSQYKIIVKENEYALVYPGILEDLQNLTRYYDSTSQKEKYMKNQDAIDNIEKKINDLYLDMNNVKNFSEGTNNINAIEDYNSLDLDQRLKFMDESLQLYEKNNINQNHSSTSTPLTERQKEIARKIGEIKYGNRFNFDEENQIAIKNLKSTIAISFLDKKTLIESAKSFSSDPEIKTRYLEIFKTPNVPITNYYAKDFVNKSLVLVIWGIISIGLMSLAIFKYLRKDFK